MTMPYVSNRLERMALKTKSKRNSPQKPFRTDGLEDKIERDFGNEIRSRSLLEPMAPKTKLNDVRHAKVSHRHPFVCCLFACLIH